MSYQNLFRIILKIIGIFFIKDILAMFPELFSAAYFFQGGNDDFLVVVYTIIPFVAFVVYCFMAYFLIAKSDWVIEKLDLMDAFEDENIKFSIHRSTIFSMVLLVVGVYIIIDSTPYFISNILTYIRDNELSQGGSFYNINYQPTLVEGFKILIAYILIKNQKRIVSWIVSRSGK